MQSHDDMKSVLVKLMSGIFSSAQQGLEELNELIHDFSSLVHVSLLNILLKYSNFFLAYTKTHINKVESLNQSINYLIHLVIGHCDKEFLR